MLCNGVAGHLDGVDLAARRRDFPALDTHVHGHRLAYLDSAATALRPRAVIDAVTRAMLDFGNPGRSVHTRAEAAATAVAAARAAVARRIHAAADEVIFTSGTTASINLVAQTWGRANLQAGDVVVACEHDHHANMVSWELICRERGAELRLAPVDDRGQLDLERLDRLDLLAGAKLFAAPHVSNVLGTVAPIAELARRAHAAGALLLVDGAQSVAHVEVDVAALGCDFYAFSGHKLYGPTGTGVLWGRAEILATMPPWQGGGGMISRVDPTGAGTTFREPPVRFEAGTPNVSGIAGLGAALAYIETFDARADEARAHAKLVETVRAAGGRILGDPELAVVSFDLPRVHPHDVATLCDAEGVALRSGHHCAQPIHRRFGVDASCRVSIGCYTDDDDVAQLARALAKVREVFP